MKVKELKEYLDMYSDDEEVRIIAANPQKRMQYLVYEIWGIMDAEVPVICVEVEEGKPLGEAEVKAAEEDERNDGER